MNDKQLKQAVQQELKKYNLDAWANVIVGLSKQEDKRKYTQYGEAEIISDQELEAAYSSDGIGTKIVDVVADDMTREWIDIEPVEEGELAETQQKIIEVELERLEAQKKFNEALKWARLYGGSIIVIGANDGNDLDKPLNINTVREITYLRVVDRSDIYISESLFDTDPNSKTFGSLQLLRVQFEVGATTTLTNVHPSRCLFFYGKTAPNFDRVDTNIKFWGYSELQPIWGILSDLGSGFESVVNVLYEFSVAVFKLDGLANMMATGEEDKVIKRMEIINVMKSVLHGVLLGENEDFRRENITFAGVSDVIDRLMMRLSGSITIPLTRLFGRSPSGLNATGEGDEKIYYDVVRAAQGVKLTKPLRQLITVIQAEKKIKGLFEITYKPLYQPTEKEQAETDKIKADTEKVKADTYQVYVNMGALSGEEVYLAELAEQFDDIRTIAAAQFAEEEDDLEEDINVEDGIMSKLNPFKKKDK